MMVMGWGSGAQPRRGAGRSPAKKILPCVRAKTPILLEKTCVLALFTVATMLAKGYISYRTQSVKALTCFAERRADGFCLQLLFTAAGLLLPAAAANGWPQPR